MKGSMVGSLANDTSQFRRAFCRTVHVTATVEAELQFIELLQPSAWVFHGAVFPFVALKSLYFAENAL